MRGILGGTFWGLVVGGAAVAGVSLVNPPAGRDDAAGLAENALPLPDSDGSEAPVAEAAVPDVTEPEEGAAPETPSAETAVEVDQQPEAVTAPETEAAPVVVEDETPPAPADDQDPEVESQPSDIADAVVTPSAPEETLAPETVSSVEAAPETVEAPAAVSNVDDDVTTAPTPETAPAEQPDVAATDAIETPEVADSSGVITGGGDTPVLPNPQSEAPSVPGTDSLDLADADTSDPLGRAPDLSTDAPVVGDAPVDDGVSPEVDLATDDTLAAPSAPEAPAAPEVSDATPDADTAPPAPETEVATGPIGEDTVIVVEDAPEVVVVEDTSTPTVSVLPGGSNAVKVNRFGADADTGQLETAEPAPDPESFPKGTPAIVRYGVPGENPNDLPELSVILVDDGSLPNAVNAVANVGFPVSVMLDPSAADATEKMNAYRSAGIEVGFIAKLPPSATPSDVAIFFEAALGSLSETVAVLDAGGETQADTEVIRETVAALAEDGRGLITVPRGLNSAQRVASENGVPAGVIYRELDAENQDARVIARFLDQAAFRARQESGVILLGQVRDQTVAALTDWATGSRAQQVAMQPVSVILNDN